MRKPTAIRKQDRTRGAALAANWLEDDQQSADVWATARAMLAIQEAAREVLPGPLADACQVARMERQRITLAVPSAAYAAKLRQLAPRIAHLLAGKGWNIQEITVKVHAGLPRQRTESATQRDVVPLGENALQAFDDLRHSVRPGPLADAIERLLAHHRR
ncbi:DUF721 domain-containing protein [Pusillimonas sp. TS35]|uniref:DciA family protein n=1 Tax=Paracandidimonas lactea TaxID=2895524 RepID=UPI00136D517D|nr:DciA family protein [Paracandidimonas lactea]MYN14940.1 DUF721 domain-containing protein [Pusillimonas sp. TS35]